MRRIFPNLSEMFSNPFVRLRLALLLAALILAVGTFGYVRLEHLLAWQGLYQTIIVLSGVGVDQIKPLNTASRVWTMGLIVFGLSTIAWVFTTIIEVFVSETSFRIMQRKRMEKRVGALSRHYIICGYGRIGQQIALTYTREKVPFVVVEQEASRLEMLREANYLYVNGDAADDDALSQAGIERAAALIAVTPTDATNTFIVLSARGLRPDLWIVARSDTLASEGKLVRAGANKVVSTHVLGGNWMGITALNPAVTEFVTAMTELDHSNFVLHEFHVLPTSAFAGQKFGAARMKERTGALIVAVRSGAEGHKFAPNPPDDLVILAGDILISIGSVAQQNALAKLVNAEQPDPILPHGMHAVSPLVRRSGRGVLPGA